MAHPTVPVMHAGGGHGRPGGKAELGSGRLGDAWHSRSDSPVCVLWRPCLLHDCHVGRGVRAVRVLGIDGQVGAGHPCSTSHGWGNAGGGGRDGAWVGNEGLTGQSELGGYRARCLPHLDHVVKGHLQGKPSFRGFLKSLNAAPADGD